MDKKGKKGNVVSIILTILVIAIYLVPNFVSAVSVSVVTDKKAYTSQDDTITFNLRVDVQNNERIPIQNLNLDIKSETGKTFECKFTTSGEPVSKCSNIDITKVSVHSFSKGEGYGYGYGYGPGTGWGNISTYFGDGYGYGYGYGDQNIYPDELNYTITWNFKSASAEAGTYKATLEAYAEGSDGVFTYKTTSPAQFTISEETDVEAAEKNLTDDRIKKNNPDLYNVTSDLNLITIGLKDTKIKWTSSNSNIINSFSGKVTRPSANEQNKIVELKANISKTGQSLSKQFNVTVLKESITDESAVKTALDAITISNILLSNIDKDNVITNLNLSTKASNGVTLSWSSNNPSVIEKTGSVSRTSADTSVKLTVTATKGSATNSTSFTVTVKGTSDPNLIDLSKAKLALTDLLILNGNPAKDNVIANLNLPTSLTGYSGVVISWSSNNAAIVKNGTVTRSTTDDIEVTLTATFTKNEQTMTKLFILTVKKKTAPAEVVDNKVTVNSGETEIVVDKTNVANVRTIQVPSDVADDEVVSLNLDTLRDNEGKLNLSTNNLTLSRNTSSGLSYDVLMPKGSIVTGSDKWNGIINLPTLKAISEVTPTAETGKTKTVDVVIEVGFTGGQLNFTKAAKLTIPNMAGRKAGYTDADDVFHAIPTCTSAQEADPDTLAEGADCYTSSGADMIIWTKHFTKFAAYTETSTTTTPPTGDGGGPTGGGGYFVPKPKTIEAPKAEVPAEEVITPPTVAAPAVTPTGLAAITGAVIGATQEAVKSIWSKVIGGIVVLFIVIYLLYVTVFRSGAPLQLVSRDHNWYYNRASLIHRKADEAYRVGKRSKAERLFKKAQSYRETGEHKQG